MVIGPPSTLTSSLNDVVVESLPKLPNVECDVAFFDKTVGPDRLEKKFFAEDTSGMLNKHQKQVEHLRRNWDRLAVPA